LPARPKKFTLEEVISICLQMIEDVLEIIDVPLLRKPQCFESLGKSTPLAE